MNACQRFEEDGTRILGTVLNDWDPNKGEGYGYGYGHYTRSYYQYQSKKTSGKG